MSQGNGYCPDELQSVTEGCFTLTTMEACINSKDGRNQTYGDNNEGNFYGQPCRWCCGNECDDNGRLCEP